MNRPGMDKGDEPRYTGPWLEVHQLDAVGLEAFQFFLNVLHMESQVV